MQLTDTAQNVRAFEWAPDSRRMVVVLKDPTPAELEAKAKGDDYEEETAPPWVVTRRQFKTDYVGYLDSRRTPSLPAGRRHEGPDAAHLRRLRRLGARLVARRRQDRLHQQSHARPRLQLRHGHLGRRRGGVRDAGRADPGQRQSRPRRGAELEPRRLARRSHRHDGRRRHALRHEPPRGVARRRQRRPACSPRHSTAWSTGRGSPPTARRSGACWRTAASSRSSASTSRPAPPRSSSAAARR